MTSESIQSRSLRFFALSSVIPTAWLEAARRAAAGLARRRGQQIAQMKSKSYTFFIASGDGASVRRVRVPLYALHFLTLLLAVGSITVVAALGSYTRMFWKVANYNSLRREQDSLKVQYRQLQTQARDTDDRLNSLQSLAGEVATAYGINRFSHTPFGLSDNASDQDVSYQRSVDQFNFLERYAPSDALLSNTGTHLMPISHLTSLAVVPSLWPVRGQITGYFGQRMDPFSGEGAFHAGIDIASHYGDGVVAAADGTILVMEQRAGYGRLIVVDHGLGVATWYGHLSAFSTHVGMQVKRGEIIGYEGQSGKSTGPHLHYEVRINNTPVNPFDYLKSTSYVAASGGD
jgi:murein DD-endopeptidase MepM/ murein hydrolase activator NlpD